MTKTIIVLLFSVLFSSTIFCQEYHPTQANLQARSEFQDNKFGLFIHWGPFSILGDGEWVMNNENIPIKDYLKLTDFFNPVSFDAHEWVAMAKDAGMKYITLITRHHDGFSMWDTKYSDFNIMNTPYKKDIVKLIAAECKKQNIKLVLYYSLLDWGREDYPHETGRTGQKSGRSGQGDYTHYLQFMKNQLTELLTNYGPIAGIWFDGHWDQTKPEGDSDRTSRINWRYDEIYSLIHKLQPQCLIGNNHHLTPFPGEDFQMFERDLPGENKSGLSFQKASEKLPLETCETMNNSWGFNIRDDNYKSVKELIHYLVNAAGRNANFLLNVGPMPNGKMQTEFSDTLKKIGQWLEINGETIYGTRGNVIAPADWGVATSKDKIIYLHVLKQPKEAKIKIENFPGKVISCKFFADNSSAKFTQQNNSLTLNLEKLNLDNFDNIIKITTE